MIAALDGIRVIDFTTLLPGPLATLMMAECGADVVKIERPGTGDEMREYGPYVNGQSVPFMQLNRGKRSLTLDLKCREGVERALSLAKEADILIEQFRPGVMEALGLGYEAIKRINPEIIYCSITGYGQEGSHARIAGHDLNYAASAGLLLLNIGEGEKPVLPHVPLADIAGGSYPALFNILLALRRRSAGGGGMHIDISMTHGLAPLMYGAMARLEAPHSQDERVFSGGSPRYQIYTTSDQQYFAVAAVEDRFWRTFCALAKIDLDADIETVSKRISQEPLQYWVDTFEGVDVCCSQVRSVAEYQSSGLFSATGRSVELAGAQVNELPLPLSMDLRVADKVKPAPVIEGREQVLNWLER
ncbi:CoA transferase [Parapusillimonas granuli]|uniref:CoA transferase n=1 Tax=Parapusillimonas granuli TaxID=380911 RepID=A0A853G4M6_9BURK|nr:crotonobetainyl-CoA:carnitine CoA-transferase CaiB-like acyl-CoA transferase [Parapusillimonas granuli]NYT50772.1 CoA transferase [Parapusillimonas granuli]